MLSFKMCTECIDIVLSNSVNHIHVKHSANCLNECLVSVTY